MPPQVGIGCSVLFLFFPSDLWINVEKLWISEYWCGKLGINAQFIPLYRQKRSPIYGG